MEGEDQFELWMWRGNPWKQSARLILFMYAILADGIFTCIFLNQNDRIPIQISLKFVPRSPIDNKPALVQIMAWRRIGDKPLSESMQTQFTDAYMRHYGEMC